jgi:hypothetical protein
MPHRCDNKEESQVLLNELWWRKAVNTNFLHVRRFIVPSVSKSRRNFVAGVAALTGAGSATKNALAQQKPKTLQNPTTVKWPKPIADAADLQIAAASLANRYETNGEFKKLIDSDPVGTLRKLGLGNDAVRDLIREDAYLRTIAGSKFNDVAKCENSCVCSDCCVSCWIGTGNRGKEGLTFPVEPKFGADYPTVLIDPRKDKLLENIIRKGHISPSFRG